MTMMLAGLSSTLIFARHFPSILEHPLGTGLSAHRIIGAEPMGHYEYSDCYNIPPNCLPGIAKPWSGRGTPLRATSTKSTKTPAP